MALVWSSMVLSAVINKSSACFSVVFQSAGQVQSTVLSYNEAAFVVWHFIRNNPTASVFKICVGHFPYCDVFARKFNASITVERCRWLPSRVITFYVCFVLWWLFIFGTSEIDLRASSIGDVVRIADPCPAFERTTDK